MEASETSARIRNDSERDRRNALLAAEVEAKKERAKALLELEIAAAEKRVTAKEVAARRMQEQEAERRLQGLQ